MRMMTATKIRHQKRGTSLEGGAPCPRDPRDKPDRSSRAVGPIRGPRRRHHRRRGSCGGPESEGAIARAKRSLADATSAAVKAHAGYRAVSTTPKVDSGRPVVEVTLVRGDDWKVVTERLD